MPLFNNYTNFSDLTAPRKNPYKINFNLGDQVDPNVLPPSDTSQPDFAKRYQDVLAQDPDSDLKNTLASAPNRADYQPSKLTRLGAILSGAAAGFRNPAQGVALAHSIISNPYDTAEADYESQVKNQTTMAGLGEKAQSRKLAGIQAEQTESDSNRDYTDKRADTKFNQGITTQHQNNDDKRLANEGWGIVNDPSTGLDYRVNKDTGEKAPVGIQGSLTPEQKVNEAGATAGADAKARNPYDLAKISAQGDQNARVAGIRGDNSIQLQTVKDASRLQQVQAAHAAALAKSQDPKGREMINKTYAAIEQAEGRGINTKQYTEINPITKLPDVQQDNANDTPEDHIYKNYLRGLILNATGGNSGGGQPNQTQVPTTQTPGLTLPPGWSFKGGGN